MEAKQPELGIILATSLNKMVMNQIPLIFLFGSLLMTLAVALNSAEKLSCPVECRRRSCMREWHAGRMCQ